MNDLGADLELRLVRYFTVVAEHGNYGRAAAALHLARAGRDVVLVEERDAAASIIQAKGIGELGMCGGAAAIANAIYNACGARVFDYPMTPDRVLAAMPD